MGTYEDDRWIAAAGHDWSSSRPEIDGYNVHSTGLHHVARGLEHLDSAMMMMGLAPSPEAIHYNPSDLTACVDFMLPELAPSLSLLQHRHSTAMTANTWAQHHHQNIPVAAFRRMEEEEDVAIQLVHLLVSCADFVQRNDLGTASNLFDQMQLALTRVNTRFGIRKVAGYFVDALSQRLYSPLQSACDDGGGSTADFETLYYHFYQACPYIKFAHFTANQAILEAFRGHDRVHVVDFNLMNGLQWPALIQALALRPGGSPLLRITGIGPPSPDGRDALREVGLRLAELARSVQVRFAFRGVAASRLEHVRPWMLQVAPGEALAVNSVLQLHRLLGDRGAVEGGKAAAGEPIVAVLGWIAGLKPKIVTVVEQEADHNKPSFLDRFTEALFYYSTMFDSLEGGRAGGAQQQQQQQHSEAYLHRELCSIVCCDGPARVERHEPLVRWRDRLGRAGLRPVRLGPDAFRQASMLLTLFSGGDGYCVEEVDGCLTLGWHSRPLISASAWKSNDDDIDVDRDVNHGALILQDHGSIVASAKNASSDEVVVDRDDHLQYIVNSGSNGNDDSGDSDKNTKRQLLQVAAD